MFLMSKLSFPSYFAEMISFNNPSAAKLLLTGIESALKKGQDEAGGALPSCKRSAVLRSSALIFSSSDSCSSDSTSSFSFRSHALLFYCH